MKTSEAFKIIGGSLSKPSKMRAGQLVYLPRNAKQERSSRRSQAQSVMTVNAMKGCYVFKVVQDAQYRRLAAIKDPRWVEAMAQIINSKKPEVFRWHDSGDVQDLDHLNKIYECASSLPESVIGCRPVKHGSRTM